jgi:hypothetical protein
MTAPVVFAFGDPARQTWLALSKDGARYHYVHPIEAGDFRVRDELRRVGELTCECEGGRFRGTCYVAKAAEAAESAAQAERTAAWDARPDALEDPFAKAEPTWFDGPPGEAAEVFGK